MQVACPFCSIKQEEKTSTEHLCPVVSGDKMTEVIGLAPCALNSRSLCYGRSTTQLGNTLSETHHNRLCGL